VKCPDCGTPVLKGLAVCPSCGKSVQSRIPTVRCRYCGAKVPKGVQRCPQCGRVPTLRRRVSLLLLSVLLGIALGVGATVVGRDYLSEVRHKLGVMLIEGSGQNVNDIPALSTPTVTPVP
jgi:hypothetical protein